MLQLGIEAVDQGQFEQALDLFNDGLKLNTTHLRLNASLHSNKGYALMKLKRHALASVECGKAIDLVKDMWRPYWVRHAAWRDVGLYTKAAEVFLIHFPLAKDILYMTGLSSVALICCELSVARLFADADLWTCLLAQALVVALSTD